MKRLKKVMCITAEVEVKVEIHRQDGDIASVYVLETSTANPTDVARQIMQEEVDDE